MTNPLRPEISGRATLGRWLRTQTAAIAPAWIESVKTRPPVRVQGAQLPPVVESTFEDIYDGLVIALEVARYDDLEQAANALVANHLPVGYSLGDLLGMLLL